MRKVSQKDRKTFLALVAEDGNVTGAAEAVDRHRDTFYGIAETDVDFGKAFAFARMSNIHRLEENVLDWARNGFEITSIETYISAKGVAGRSKTKTEIKIDPKLALRILERRHPDYKPTSEISVDTPTGVLIMPAPLTLEQWEAAFNSDE